MAVQRHRPHRGLPFVLSVVCAAATVLLVAGCASTHGLAPEGRALEADSLASNRSLGTVALSDAAFPAHDWWTALGDPQLDALVDEALRDSPSLAAADARVRQAQAQAGLADAARKPTLGASARESVVRLPETLAPEPLGGDVKASTVLMLDFKWAPDLWGGQRAKYEAAVGQARATQVDAQAARLTLSSNVARGYIALARAHEMLDVAQREQARASHLRDLAQQRVDAGLDNQLQLRQSESTIAAARQQAQYAQMQIDALRNALAALVGKGPDRGLDITRPRLLDAPSPAVPAVLPSELLGHRADVVAARWRVEAASRGIDASKAAFKPSINLNALVGLASSGLSELFGGDALLGFGGPAISLPIFDGGGLRSQLAKADADYDLALAGYNQALVSALHEVTDAVQAARSLDAQIASAAQARDAAQSALQLADTRYRAGLGTQLEVLSAQRPLLQLEQQLVALRAPRYGATVDIDRALGGGLVPIGPDTGTSSETHPDLAKAPTP
jgi:NodT family efflux transporter outer membrane factor (OMF) lipoprotein